MSQSDSLDIRRSTLRNPLDIPIQFVAGRFGARSREIERLLKFAVVGVFGAMVDFGTVILLQATLLSPTEPNKDLKVVLASTCGFLAAVISNFIWNRYWTYPDSRSRSMRRQLVQFTVINLIGWIARTLWINISYEWLGVTLMPLLLTEIQWFRPGYIPSHSAEAKLGALAAQLIGVVFVMIWNFTANRYWTYNDVE